MVLEKALKDCIRNVVWLFEATFSKHSHKNIYKTFISNGGVGPYCNRNQIRFAGIAEQLVSVMI
jgi:hypothetical protein